jgi:uncharacterized protein YdeI (YjbR/CyaY-like superfamily)
MTDAGRAKLPHDVKPPAPRLSADDPVPDFVAKAIAKDREAKKNFDALAPGYRRDYLRYITEAKKEETKAKRLKQAITWLRQNRKRLM